MKVKDIYLSIKLGIVPLGKYAEGTILDTEIALKLDTAIQEILNETKEKELVQENSFYSNLLSDLMVREPNLNVTKEGNEYICILPSNFIHSPVYSILFIALTYPLFVSCYLLIVYSINNFIIC